MEKLKIFLLAVSVLALSSFQGYGWGRTGHDAVTAIAERHLTRKAKAAVEDILDGK